MRFSNCAAAVSEIIFTSPNTDQIVFIPIHIVDNPSRENVMRENGLFLSDTDALDRQKTTYIVGKPLQETRNYFLDADQTYVVRQEPGLEYPNYQQFPAAEIQSEEPDEQEESIPEQSFGFYYTISGEVDRVQKELNKGTSLAELDKSIENNLIKALEEFAGHVEMTKLPPFTWRNGCLIPEGMTTPLSEMMREFAENQDEPRPWADYEGISAIENGFNQGANVAVLISPPSFGEAGFGTYGFCNVIINDGSTATEYILRYEGEESHLPLSNALQAGLRSQLQSFDDLQLLPDENQETADENHFLRTPLIVSMENPRAVLAEILTNAGFIEAKHMEVDNMFLKAITMDATLSAWMKEYKAKIITILSLSPSEERTQLEAEAAELRDLCYNRARAIKKILDTQESLSSDVKDAEIIAVIESQSLQFDTLDQERRHYAAINAVVLGGGSCPGVEARSGESYGGINYSGGFYEIAAQLFGKKEKYIFNKEGTCKKCSRESKKVGKLGPCFVCRGCQAKFDRGIYK